MKKIFFTTVYMFFAITYSFACGYGNYMNVNYPTQEEVQDNQKFILSCEFFNMKVGKSYGEKFQVVAVSKDDTVKMSLVNVLTNDSSMFRSEQIVLIPKRKLKRGQSYRLICLQFGSVSYIDEIYFFSREYSVVAKGKNQSLLSSDSYSLKTNVFKRGEEQRIGSVSLSERPLKDRLFLVQFIDQGNVIFQQYVVGRENGMSVFLNRKYKTYEVQIAELNQELEKRVTCKLILHS